MRSFKILFIKCLRDFWHNFKQFISIIFILGVAVTLFVGFQANSQEFERRVNNVYELGNISDIWVTYNMDSESLDGANEDYEAVVDINGGDESLVERRLYASATISGNTVYTLMSRKYPTINVAYNLETLETADEYHYFYVDSDFIDRMEIAGIEIGLGSTVSLTFDTSTIVSSVESLFDSLQENLVEYLELGLQAELPEWATDIIEQVIDSEELSSAFDDIYDLIFSDSTFAIDLEINGIMSHPENIQSSTFNSSSVMVSLPYVIEAILDDIEEVIDELGLPSDITSTIESIVSYFDTELTNEDNETITSLLDNISNQFVLQVGEGKTVDEVTYNINQYYNSRSNCSLLAITDIESMPSNMIVQNDIVSSRQLALVFPIIFFVVAILVVLTTISALILKDRIQIGTLKSLGFTKLQIFLYYVGMMEIVTVIGVAIGFIIGPLLVPYIMNIKYDILYSLTSLEYLFPWFAALMILVVVMVAVALITFLLIYKQLKEEPSEAMRPKAPTINLKETKLGERTGAKHTSLMMALRNMRVHIAKSLMVIVGVMGCTGLLICGFGVEDVMDYGKDVDLNGFMSMDITATYSSYSTAGVMKEKLLSLTDENGDYYISAVDEVGYGSTTLSSADGTSTSGYYYYFDQDNDFFKYTTWDTRGVALDESTADTLGISEGDTLYFTASGTTYSMEVVEIFYTFTVKGVFIYTETMPELTDQRIQAAIWVNDGYTHEEVVEVLTSSEDLNILSAVTYEDNMEKIDGYMSSIEMMTTTIKVFAIVLAVIVLINLSILNYRERLRDLATLKVLGFSLAEISRSLIYETMILTVIGSILGALIGFPLECLVLVTNTTPLLSYHYTLTIWSVLVSGAISILTAFVVNLIMTRSIKNISMTEALKSIE